MIYVQQTSIFTLVFFFQTFYPVKEKLLFKAGKIVKEEKKEIYIYIYIRASAHARMCVCVVG